MNLEQAYNIVKNAAEAAPLAKEGHVLVEKALKLIAQVVNEKIKSEQASPKES